jgi:hypothetical protein
MQWQMTRSAEFRTGRSENHDRDGNADMLIDAEVGLVLTVIMIAVFWRAILRLVLAALGAGILLALGFGVFGVIAFIRAAHA